MALTMPRWLLAALTALVIGFVLLVHVPDEPSPYDRESARLRRIESTYEQRLRVLSQRLRVRRSIDSVRVALGTRPSGDVRVAYAAALPPDFRILAESLVTRATRKASGTSEFGIDIAVIQGPKDQFGPYVSYVLPAGPRDRCLVVVPISGSDRGYFSVKRLMRTQAAVDQLLGPCAFYKAFGAPGPKIREWLDRRGWSLGADGSWTVDASTNLGQEREPSGRLTWGAMNLSPLALECLAGRSAVCESAAVRPLRNRGLTYHGNILAEQFVRLGSESNYSTLPLGYREGFLLADMVRMLGREQFGRFWRSADDVPEAFARAAGTPLGHWISQWMVRQYGEIQARPVAVSTYSTMVALLLMVLAIFVSFCVATNRQFA